MWTRTKKTGFRIQDSGYTTPQSPLVKGGSKRGYRASCILYLAPFLLFTAVAFAEELKLQPLIDEALNNNQELIVSGLKVSTSKYKIPQVQSLPDPMFMLGYQNEGYDRYTYGEMQGAQWMFSASQMFPFPGKLSLKGEMALRDSESLKALYESAKLTTIARIKELYYELFLTYKNIDLIRDKTALFSRIEDAAIARYSSGMAPQQEVLMAQTEKYMLLEKEEMLKQKMQSIEAMLNTAVGRDVNSPLGIPVEPVHTSSIYNIAELIKISHSNSPLIKSREKMIAAAKAKVNMAEKEYYPDFTIAGSVFERRGEFKDMWSLTTTINIPIFYKTKQKMAVLEAESALSEAKHELEAVKLMLSSNIRENYSMIKAAEKLTELYRNGLIPKAYQDFELAISGYVTGKVEAITVITRLKSLIDYELLYWGQFIEREKAVARLEAITSVSNQKSVVKKENSENVIARSPESFWGDEAISKGKIATPSARNDK
ncbi:MAG TPA: hypothetical protein DD713_07645 [Nitrospiraceae bacterium]|nr:hypothetical protein [Nitrospiraceae bacterium]